MGHIKWDGGCNIYLCLLGEGGVGFKIRGTEKVI